MKEDGRIVAFSSGVLIMRLVIGLALLLHGGQIMFQWWSGLGMQDYANYLEIQGLDFFIGPLGWAWVIALAQFVGGILLVFGLLTRLTAFVNAVVLVLIFSVIEMEAGYFISMPGLSDAGDVVMNYLGGGEYSLVLAGVLAGLFLTGAGKYSLDSGFAVRPRKPKEEAKPAEPPKAQ